MTAAPTLTKVKDVIQDCNLNFLIGSGLSAPYLHTLGSIENLLTSLDDDVHLDNEKKAIIKCSLYKHYFDVVMARNLEILSSDDGAKNVLEGYKDFLTSLNTILLRRKSSILGKGVNIFTTNIDIFLEVALEEVGLECNDGFNGRFKPSFSLSNFNNSRYKRSLHFDNISELPVFNLLKLHGSLTWKLDRANKIVFSPELNHVKEVKDSLVPGSALLEINAETTLPKLATAVTGMPLDNSVLTFLDAYEKLLVVNPTKEKFKSTLLNYTHYELLRIYSNELEKDNSVLFVMGFSFADQHIREITLRAANSNPTLLIYVIAHTSTSATQIRALFGTNTIKNANITFVAPTRGEEGDNFAYDLATINREIFGKLFSEEAVVQSAGVEDQES